MVTPSKMLQLDGSTGPNNKEIQLTLNLNLHIHLTGSVLVNGQVILEEVVGSTVGFT